MWWDFLTTLFDAEWFFDLLERSPAQLIVYTLVVFALGAAAGFWAGKKATADIESKVSEKEHKITRLTTQLEAEKTRAASVDGLRKSLEEATQNAEGASKRASELGSKVRELEDELARQRDGEEQRLAEQREHVIRAHNLIAQLNRHEAKALRSLIDGNNQLVVTDPGTTGLLSFGAIKFLADTGSYIPGTGELGYFNVSPLWRLYASWERDLLDQRADGKE